MSINLRLGLIIVSFIIFLVTILILGRRRMPVKYSIVWLFSSLLILLIAVVPQLFIWLSKLLGFVTMSNMVIGLFIFILLMITIILTVIVSGQRKKITLLIQEVSMLKENVKKTK